MKLIELKGTQGVAITTLDERGVPIMGSLEWTEIYSIEVVGERPAMIVDAPLHFFTFGTGQFSTDTMICLYHIDQGPFPTRLMIPQHQNATVGLRAGGGAKIDWTLEVALAWRRIEPPKRWP